MEIPYDKAHPGLRRLDFSTVEVSHRVDFDGEYTVRFGFPGERTADAKPVKMNFWMDGQLLGSIDVETKPSKLVTSIRSPMARCGSICRRAIMSSAPLS